MDANVGRLAMEGNNMGSYVCVYARAALGTILQYTVVAWLHCHWFKHVL